MSAPAEPAAHSPSRRTLLPQLSLSARRIGAVHALVIVLLVLAHVATQFVKHFAGREFMFGIVPMFDMDAEGSVPAAAQGLALAFAALLLGWVAWHERAHGRATARRWLVLAIALAYVALDELGKIHEIFDFIGNGGGSADVPFWIAPLGAFALGVALYMLPLLRALPRATARALVLAGAIYVAGAVGIEIVSQKPVAWVAFGSFPYAMQVAVEEGLEMLGVLVLIRTLLRHIAAHDYRAALGARA